MNINKFVNIPKEDIFHSSGYAKVATSGSFGAASTETFERRHQINRSRRAVRGYGESMIGQGHMREVARPQLNADSPLQQSGVMSPSRQQYNARSAAPIAVPKRTFTEPPGRGYNPYS